jgi:hypothetical protein
MNTALARGAVPYKARSVAWYDPLTGEILDERDEQVVKVQPHASVVEVLRTVRARMLYLLPDETGRYPERSWFTGCIEIGCKIDKYLSKTHSATISRGEKIIDIHPVGQYFDTAPSVQECKKSWVLLASLLRGAFGEHATLMGTAGATGLHLLRLSLPKGEKYEALPDDVRDIILHNFGQGRIETFYRNVTMPTVYEIDGVWMYMACLRDVPTGRCEHDMGGEIVNQGYTPGFYRVTATVPADWSHIGLLPTLDEKAVRRRADTKSYYPATPGQTFESWCTASELRFALERGWKVQICERIFWPERSSDPLRLWAERLKRLRERGDFLGELQREMLRQAIRSIVLKAIGSFHRHEVSQDSYVASADEVPDSAEMWDDEGDIVHYWEDAELSRMQLQTLQPHWSAWIWGQARVRLEKAALCLPDDTLVALRTDGIWTTHDVRHDRNPMWAATGKPGSWRVKYAVHGRLWPRKYADMLDIIAIAKKQGKVS